MFSHIFDADYYTASLYAQPVLIVGILLGVLVIIVMVKERSSPVSSTFAFMTSSAALWLLATAAIYSTSFEQIAQVWSKVQMIGVVLIPCSVYIFTLTITQRLHQFRIWAWGSVALSILFYLSIILTDEFITGVRRYFWGYSFQYGVLSLPFLVFFFASMVASLRLYWVSYRNSPSQSVQQKRFRTLFFAFVVAYLASVDYLGAFSIPVYPIGYFPVFIWFLIVAFAIRRYHLFDITPSFAANQILTMMADALLVLDRQGVVHVVNQAACELLGEEEADLVGMPITTISGRFFTPQQTTSLSCNGGVYSYEISLATKQDDVRVLSVSASWMRDHTNQPVGMIYIAQDITERKRTEDQVRTLNMELEQRVMERTAQLQNAVEERERIAMDIHDGVIQSLYAVALGLSAHERLLGVEAEETRQALQRARMQISDIIQEIRDVIFDLRQHRRHFPNLQTGLESLVTELFGPTLIQVDLELEDGVDHFLNPVRASGILYIAREAMSNVVRHAGASKVVIHLGRIDEKLVLTIRDNGRGFNPAATDVENSGPAEGQGLRNMGERAQLLGGRLLVASSLGCGTEVYVEMRV